MACLAPSPRRYGASSAFPTLTGLVALAAGLAVVYGPANAPETPSKPCARHRDPPALWIPRGKLGPH
ncbi:hypothetical protein HTS61_09120 [Escherichia coli]|nr:hypothetical protein [Escherichia coli]